MGRFLTRSTLVAGVASLVLVLSLSGAHAAPGFGQPEELLEFMLSLRDPVGFCGGQFPDASATFQLKQLEGETWVRIRLEDAKPDTLYTLWLVLTPAGSPLTGARITPMVPSDVAAELIGVDDDPAPPNGFMTDANGDGTFVVHLDFPLLGGAYPFHRVNPDLDPVAFNFSLTPPPAVFAVVSHCIDNMGHGLIPGTSENWFRYAPQD